MTERYQYRTMTLRLTAADVAELLIGCNPREYGWLRDADQIVMWPDDDSEELVDRFVFVADLQSQDLGVQETLTPTTTTFGTFTSRDLLYGGSS